MLALKAWLVITILLYLNDKYMKTLSEYQQNRHSVVAVALSVAFWAAFGWMIWDL